MATLAQRSEMATWWPGVPVVGLGLLAALQVDAALWMGGLAPIGVAALVAAAIGIPLVSETWRRGPQQDPLADTIGETLLLVAVGAAIAAVASSAGALGALGVIVGFPVIAVLVNYGGLWVGGVTTGIALAWTLGMGVFCWFRYDGLTLLEPSWFAWQDWLAWSLTAGLLLTTAGLGRWAEAPAAVPGHRRVPWATTGLALLAVIAAAIIAASVAEGAAPRGLWISVAALMATALSTTALVGPQTARRRRLGIGVIATLWFLGPGGPGIALFWTTLLPVGLALAIASRTRQSAGRTSAPGVLATGVALTAAVLGWPGLPDGTWTAAAAAATLVGLVWVVGTRFVLVERTA